MLNVCVCVYRVLQVLANFSDLDDYYDVVDCLEEQGMERIMNVCYLFVRVLVCPCLHMRVHKAVGSSTALVIILF